MKKGRIVVDAAVLSDSFGSRAACLWGACFLRTLITDRDADGRHIRDRFPNNLVRLPKLLAEATG